MAWLEPRKLMLGLRMETCYSREVGKIKYDRNMLITLLSSILYLKNKIVSSFYKYKIGNILESIKVHESWKHLLQILLAKENWLEEMSSCLSSFFPFISSFLFLSFLILMYTFLHSCNCKATFIFCHNWHCLILLKKIYDLSLYFIFIKILKLHCKM